MKRAKLLRVGAVILASLVTLIAITYGRETKPDFAPLIDKRQVPTWSDEDLNFFLHGSMSAEVIPENVLRAFIKIYPDLFPSADLGHLGLLPDAEFGWPIGISRTRVKHLGNLSAIGINCASCHIAQIEAGGEKKWLLGATSHFDVETFFGSVLVATFRTADPPNMKKFLRAYSGKEFKDWNGEAAKTDTKIADGDLYEIPPNELSLDGEPNLPLAAGAFLKLFHNMRAALHVPDTPPEKIPPASGPGRNDAFGILSASLLNAPQPYAPTKFGLVWNVGERHWVHWDGNTNSPIARNLLASLGLGAPIHGKRGQLDFAMVKRQTDLSEKIEAPRYPFAIDNTAAKRGAPLFNANCNSCHGGPESDKRLYSIQEIGTDPHRAELFTEKQAERFNKFLAELEAEGYTAPKEAGVRSTGKYWAATLRGVWARSPYLHNGSVRTMEELLSAPNERSKSYRRGAREYDEMQMGYVDGGAYVFDTAGSGNSNSGHDYGTKLTAAQKHDLIEYLKTL